MSFIFIISAIFQAIQQLPRIIALNMIYWVKEEIKW
jgi:hypothetical protein